MSSTQDDHDDERMNEIGEMDVRLYRQRDEREMMISQMWYEVSPREE